MATKLDENFTNGVKDGVNALVSEVKRPEAYVEELEKFLTAEQIFQASQAASKKW